MEGKEGEEKEREGKEGEEKEVEGKSTMLESCGGSY